jgi:hypothetical protein
LDLLRDGIIWKIGGGNSANIWSDPWLPRGSTRRPITPKGRSLLTKVSDLIDPVSGTWDEQLVMDTFWPEDAHIILAIPTDPQMEDWPAWHYDSKGLFSVKSAYKLAVQIRDSKLNKDALSSSSGSLQQENFK